jgi:hypothetical protein
MAETDQFRRQLPICGVSRSHRDLECRTMWIQSYSTIYTTG